jgi:carboxyl-terminal processing protease
VDRAIAEFESAKVNAIVVDLRENHGGSFEDAITVSERFVTAGQTIVRVQMRSGETARVSKGAPKLASVPISVLVGKETASGAELFAAALRDARGATVIGKRTFGKGTLQSVEVLPNGYGIKFTVGLFSTPNGKAIQTDGLIPDVEVDGDDVSIFRTSADADITRVIAADPPLRTTLSLLFSKKR